MVVGKIVIAEKNGVAPGDKLLKIGDLDVATLTRGQLIAAQHGTPEEHKRLVLERAGKNIEVEAAVTGF